MALHQKRGAASEPVVVHPGMQAREAARESEIERWAVRRVRALKHFYTHLSVFCLINFAILGVDLSTSGGPWFFYPLLAWGLVLGLHAAHTFERLPWLSRDWEERKLGELIEQARRQSGGSR